MKGTDLGPNVFREKAVTKGKPQLALIIVMISQ